MVHYRKKYLHLLQNILLNSIASDCVSNSIIFKQSYTIITQSFSYTITAYENRSVYKNITYMLMEYTFGNPSSMERHIIIILQQFVPYYSSTVLLHNFNFAFSTNFSTNIKTTGKYRFRPLKNQFCY